jgi:formylglycine-generating enzyme required for sulfatase activity
MIALALLPVGLNAEAPASPPDGMALISGGSYVPMFTKDAKPRSVAPFFLDKLPVTNGRFLEFVREHPEWQRSRVKPVFADASYLKHWAGDLDLGPGAPPDAPVTHVSWFAARAFLKARGQRLPTMDEWEFAARAEAHSADASGSEAFTRRLLSWYAKPMPKVLPPAHEAEAGTHGVRGLHGLVWEWVLDFNSAMTTGEGRDGNALDRDLFCGAGALSATDMDNYAAFMRYAFRSSLQGNYCVASLGFRGAQSVPAHP